MAKRKHRQLVRDGKTTRRTYLRAHRQTRSRGKSYAGLIAYRFGKNLKDSRTGRTYYYLKSKASEILASGMVGKLAEGTTLEQTLEAFEKSEKRKDSCLGRDLVIELPLELQTIDGSLKEVTWAFAEYLSNKYNTLVWVAIHDKEGNPHAHLLVPNYEYDQGVQPGTRLNILLDRNTFAKELKEWKEELGLILNKTLEKNGFRETLCYDHRSYRESGLDLRRQCHRGNGLEADARTELNNIIRQHNELVLDRMEIRDKIAELRQREKAKTLRDDVTVTKIDPEQRIEAEEISIPEAIKQEGPIEQAPPFTLCGSNNPAQGESKSKDANNPNDPISTAPIVLPIEVDDTRNNISKKSTDKKKRKRTRHQTDYVDRQINRIEKLFEHLTAGIAKTNYNLTLFPGCAIVNDSFKASSIRLHELRNSIFKTLEKDIPACAKDKQISMGDPFAEVPKLLNRIGLSLRQARKLSSTLAENDAQSISRIVSINTDTLALLASVKDVFQVGLELSKSAGLTADTEPQSPTATVKKKLQNDSHSIPSVGKPSLGVNSRDDKRILNELKKVHIGLSHSLSILTLFKGFSSAPEDAVRAIRAARESISKISHGCDGEQPLQDSSRIQSDTAIEPAEESNDKQLKKRFSMKLKTLDSMLRELELDLSRPCTEGLNRGFSGAICFLEELKAEARLLAELKVLTPAKETMSDSIPQMEHGQDRASNGPSFEL